MLARCRTPLILFALVLAVPAVAPAQSDDEVNAGVQFNFSTPGARSLGMGGAFLASVDDATAAYSNPAGLLQLSKPEVLVEARRWRYETPFADRGRVGGPPTGRGVDTISGVELGTAESEVDGISYAAFVLPRPSWALSIYFHQVADFESAFTTGGIFGGDRRLFPVQSAYDIEISQGGLAFAREWQNGVAVGVTLSAYSFQLESLTQRYDSLGFFDPLDPASDFKVNFQTQTGDDQQLGGSIGLLWDRGGPASLGLVYRFGPEFDIEVLTSSLSPEAPRSLREEILFAGVFNLPDVVGGGITLRPSQSLTMSLDVNHVLYSEMIEEFVVIFDGSQVEDFVLEDVTEVRAGLEYLFTGMRFPLALRAGAWYDPDHRLRAETGPVLTQARFFEGEDLIHGTAGFGLSLGAVQLDVAADVSDQTKMATVSAGVRF